MGRSLNSQDLRTQARTLASILGFDLGRPATDADAGRDHGGSLIFGCNASVTVSRRGSARRLRVGADRAMGLSSGGAPADSTESTETIDSLGTRWTSLEEGGRP